MPLMASDLTVIHSVGQEHMAVIRNLQTVDSGTYTVKAVNIAGEATADAVLTVKGNTSFKLFLLLAD